MSNLKKYRIKVLHLYGTLVALAILTGLAFGPAFVAHKYAYTWSLLIWLVPDLGILWWFLSNDAYEVSRKKAFGLTTLYLFLNGLILDVFFAHHLFTFVNKDAVIGIFLPGFSISEFRFIWEHPFPIEELFFYFFGFVCILLVYIWGDEYWFEKYQYTGAEKKGAGIKTIAGFHVKAVILGFALLFLAALLKQFLNPSSLHFTPLYLVPQILMAFVPTVILLKEVGRRINWRAFSFTLIATLLISVLYEVTLGIPAQWWGYQKAPMVGIFIASWNDLPIEAVTLWYSAAFMTILVYEGFKALVSPPQVV